MRANTLIARCGRRPAAALWRKLQRLKGWGLGYGGCGFEAESGLAEESVDEGGPVLDALEPVPDDGGQLVEVLQEARLPRPLFMFAQAPSTGLRSGA